MQILINNKKSYFNYEILEKYVAGIELFGFEVKSIKQGQGSLEGAYVTIRGGEAYLIGANIPAFQAKNAPESYDPIRNRRILLTKKEIGELALIEAKKGQTIVALAMHNAGGKIKIEIGVARGKKQFDKRETIKKRDEEREIRREMKG
ncbi:MAG: SsrA-binding protein SmpB [Patescibacteria group bacterium]|nr:SsrA-binding protein SmpB [Patescibacteria group bacterium]MDE1988219.1 SsrA-binding protein SmpB [Patescibacteria group bacterium]MDE2218498.1 SsrA-binding protein SmpB [Patescibacteria group bacterium]